jgi:hypothetical protein
MKFHFSSPQCDARAKSRRIISPSVRYCEFDSVSQACGGSFPPNIRFDSILEMDGSVVGSGALSGGLDSLS